MNDKRAIVYSYFASKRGLDDTIGFSCNSIVKWCGHKADYHKNKINDQITETVTQLKDEKYIKLDGNILADIYFEAKINQEKFDIPTSFALIYLDELDKIREFKKNIENKNIRKMSSSILILTLSYLRVNMLRRQKDYIGILSDKPEFCYRMYIDIEKDLGISNRYISRAVKILEELDLIAMQEYPRWQDEYGNWHTEVTMFVNKYKRIDGGESLDMNYDYNQELKWGYEYIKDKKFLKKKFDQNTEK